MSLRGPPDNRVILIGNVTWNPELKQAETRKPVCTFGLATNRNYTDGDGEKHEETDFHRIVAFNKLAEFCHQYLRKGRKVYLEGRLHSRSWTDNEGNQKAATEIILEDVELLDKKPEELKSDAANNQGQEQAATTS